MFATANVLWLIPASLIRFLLWVTMHTMYKIRIIGRENIPFRGPALLVSNHMTHLDGFMIGACMPRFLRFMLWKPIYEFKPLHWFFKFAKAIPVGGAPRELVASIHAAREQLQAGQVVCIFAEGGITRTGNLLPFKRGLEKIAAGLDIPVIPVHLDRLWGSVFSFERGRFFWKWPKRLRYPITISFGAPMYSPSTHQVRQTIAEMASEAVMCRKSARDLLHLRFIRAARKNWSRFAMADSTGRELTYGRALTASVMVSRWAGKQREQMIGVLLPSSCGGALANLGITMSGKVPVNLNFTASAEAMAAAVEQCSIRTIVTCQVFLNEAGIDEMPGMVFLEDIFKGGGKASAMLMARVALSWMFTKKASPDALATVIFSSGSTGVSKGVMLSHYNVIANIEALVQVFSLGAGDRIMGVLPLSHSLGFTMTVWLPLITGCGAVYHTNATDSKIIGELVEKYKGTLLLSTPTFCVGYARKCTREQFASLRYVVVGAEKLREPVRRTFEDAFGLELLEGYGCTEMSPVIAVNSPNYEAGRDSQMGNKAGTVGLPLPGIAVKIVDPETMKELGSNREGLLVVKGANRMIGYLGQEAPHDDWYRTGDLAVVDDDGFLRITDRLSRFSKIGGEMIPHLKVEEAVQELFADCACAVTGIPDERRGERLALLYASGDIEPAELWRRLSETELPKVWVPKRENIYRVESLPTLGTGEADLRGIRRVAEELAGSPIEA
jgi:acyl-[acyl-carrier-protein]-phospholipid O-acyltransferase / long-chain-fatty-acid--[acyl-carrier-protein] ligase